LTRGEPRARTIAGAGGSASSGRDASRGSAVQHRAP
jgi:hypothetical protein